MLTQPRHDVSGKAVVLDNISLTFPALGAVDTAPTSILVKAGRAEGMRLASAMAEANRGVGVPFIAMLESSVTTAFLDRVPISDFDQSRAAVSGKLRAVSSVSSERPSGKKIEPPIALIVCATGHVDFGVFIPTGPAIFPSVALWLAGIGNRSGLRS